VIGGWVIRTGIVLPTFREAPDDALQVAHQAFEAGVDGVFCYDHIWPLGEPDRPALAPFPILAVLAASATLAEMPRRPGRAVLRTLWRGWGWRPTGCCLGSSAPSTCWHRVGSSPGWVPGTG